MLLEAPTSESVADWIETSVLVSDSGHFAAQKLAELAAAEIQKNEAALELGLQVMRRRSQALGDSYPFVVNEFAVVRSGAAIETSYATMLFLTPGSPARQTVRINETPQMAETFEALATVGLSNFWGPGGDSVRFAYPSAIGRPKEFDQAIEWLANRMGVEAGTGYRPPRRKDGGVDVVAWRSFRDGRRGFPIALAQCTIQGETFTKTTDIDLRLWASWLAMDSDPLSMLVIPGTIRAAGPAWNQLASVVMPIERLRLTELICRSRVPPPPDEWTDDTANELREILLASDS